MSNRELLLVNGVSILGIVNGILSLISGILVFIFYSQSNSLLNMEAAELVKVTDSTVTLALICNVLVVLFWTMCVFAKTGVVCYSYVAAKKMVFKGKEQKLLLATTFVSAFAALTSAFTTRGIKGLHQFSSWITELATKGSAFKYDPFEVTILTEKINALRYPYLLMRILIVAVGVLSIYILYINKKKAKEIKMNTEFDVNNKE